LPIKAGCFLFQKKISYLRIQTGIYCASNRQITEKSRLRGSIMLKMTSNENEIKENESDAGAQDYAAYCGGDDSALERLLERYFGGLTLSINS